MSLTIRPETRQDQSDIFAIHQAAFPTDAEARLVDALRDQGGLFLSLVAESAGKLLGHIAFSPMEAPGLPSLQAVGLAPLAVVPERQRQGTGVALIQAGIEACRERGVDAIFVLGAPDYYTRAGFVAASAYGLRCEYDVPPEAFMALELTPQSLAPWSGIARYHEAFQALT